MRALWTAQPATAGTVLGGAPGRPAAVDPALEIHEPDEQTVPFVFSSPHSGRDYPDDFLAVSQLDPVTLRRSEDAFVDDLFAAAPACGAPLLKAHFPRAYVDVNREAWELDPGMFADPLPRWVNTRSLRVASGLGTIARSVSDGADIYGTKIPFAEAEHRIVHYYQPYHATLKDLLEQTKARFGCAVLIDCHSMPSIGGPLDRDRGTNRADFVLGDRYGTACTYALSHAAGDFLRALGYRVTRNSPYAGGFCTEYYGRPALGVHALQIEINRGLYMDEVGMTRGRRFAAVKRDLSMLIDRLTSLMPDLLVHTD